MLRGYVANLVENATAIALWPVPASPWLAGDDDSKYLRPGSISKSNCSRWSVRIGRKLKFRKAFLTVVIKQRRLLMTAAGEAQVDFYECACSFIHAVFFQASGAGWARSRQLFAVSAHSPICSAVSIGKQRNGRRTAEDPVGCLSVWGFFLFYQP